MESPDYNFAMCKRQLNMDDGGGTIFVGNCSIICGVGFFCKIEGMMKYD
jgi:hypothetical protein